MKKKAVSKIARGKLAKMVVFKGRKDSRVSLTVRERLISPPQAAVTASNLRERPWTARRYVSFPLNMILARVSLVNLRKPSHALHHPSSSQEKTSTGLQKAHLMKNKRGKASVHHFCSVFALHPVPDRDCLLQGSPMLNPRLIHSYIFEDCRVASC